MAYISDIPIDKKVMLIAPVLTSYRQHLYDGLCDYFVDVTMYADAKVGKGFDSRKIGRFRFSQVNTTWFGKQFYYQRGVISGFFREKPDMIFATLDFRSINFWIILLVAKFLSVPSFFHTQGVYNKESRRSYKFYKLLFRFVAKNSSGLVCYTKSVKAGLLRSGISSSKLAVMDNTVWNLHPLPPDEKKSITASAFYIGRLREGCNIPLLFDAMEILKSRAKPLALKVVGDGEQKEELMKMAATRDLEVTFYGPVYDDRKITALSSSCRMGIYPGDAGLSLVHYMSLSLVPITHGDLAKHMGPEPSFLEDQKNGLFFERQNARDLASTIEKIIDDEAFAIELAKNAYQTYLDLGSVRMEHKLASAMIAPNLLP